MSESLNLIGGAVINDGSTTFIAWTLESVQDLYIQHLNQNPHLVNRWCAEVTEANFGYHVGRDFNYEIEVDYRCNDEECGVDCDGTHSERLYVHIFTDDVFGMRSN